MNSHKSETARTIIAIDAGCAGGIVVMRRTKIFMLGLKNISDSVIVAFLRIHAEPGCVAYLEKVSGYIPDTDGNGQPGSRMFTFGDSYGFLRGVLAALEIETKLVLPQVWQRGIPNRNGGYNDRKNALLAHARKLFPNLEVNREVADALGILHYARFVELGENGAYSPGAPVAIRNEAAEAWCRANNWATPAFGSKGYSDMLATWEAFR